MWVTRKKRDRTILVRKGVAEREVNRKARERLVAEFESQFQGLVDDWRADFRAARPQDVIAAKTRRAHELAPLAEGMTASQWQDALKGPLDIATIETSFDGMMRQAMTNAAREGARIGLRFVGVPGVEFSEARVQGLAERWVTRNAGKRIVGINAETRKGVRRVLQIALQDEISPEAAANKIGRMVGLTRREATALQNYEAARIRHYIKDPRDDTQYIREVIAQELEQKRDLMLRDRGRRIAETEMQEAIIGAEEQLYQELQEDDPERFPPGMVAKRWMTVLDDRVCPWCEPLHGTVLLYDELFSYTGQGGPLRRPPAHPKCRCYLEYSESGRF